MPTKKVTPTAAKAIGGKKVSKVSKVVKKTAKSAIAAKPVTPKTAKIAELKSAGLTVQVFDTAGKIAGSTKLPEKIFGQKPNKNLITQALHVYFANSQTHTAHTKTRGEVRGGGRKPWKQKGTGNARAGSKRSPLWVGGGTTFGPRTREVRLDLPKKMKRAALISVLSAKATSGSIKVVSNFEKIQPKTKTMANLLTKLDAKKHVLLVVGEKSKNVSLASRNIPNTFVETPANLNAYLVWNNNSIIFSKDALEKFV
ncbi:MAG: 50S ribosomal protein L4 [Patescibacteria group bacterium]